MKFDELNKLKRYFATMEIPQSEKDKRVSLGMFFYDAFYYVLLLMQTEFRLDGEIDSDFYTNTLDNRIRSVLEENNLPYDEDYIPRLTEDVIEVTERHLDDPYYFSQDRALLIAQNEANTVYNTIDFNDAISQGKQYKRWITEEDNRVRPWHVDVDNVRIPIDEMFHVGTDDMRFPHDYMNGSPENLINCRCACIYE